MNYYWSFIRFRGKEFQWNDSYTNGECACIISKCAETQCVSSLYFRSRCDRGFYFSCPLLLVSGDACLWVVVVDVHSFFAIKSKKKYLKMYKMSLNMKGLSWLALVRTPFKTVNTVLIWFKSSSWCSCLNFRCSYCLHLHASVQWVAALWVADWIFR